MPESKGRETERTGRGREKTTSTGPHTTVLLTDELRFEIFGSSGRIFVCFRVGKRMVPQCVTSRVKHGGGSVMVCVGSRVGDFSYRHPEPCGCTMQYPDTLSWSEVHPTVR